MGQEASLPVQEGSSDGGQLQGSPMNATRKHYGGDDSIRAGRAIKGIATVATTAATGITSAATGILHTARRNDDYSDREVARAAAEGGHFDFAVAPGSSSVLPQEHYQYPPQMTSGQQHAMEHQQHQQQYYGQPPPPPPGGHLPPSTHVDIMYTEGSRVGRGLPRPGARLINSMRNLKLGQRGPGTPAPPEHGAPGTKTTGLSSVNEWQRQWDEDDESDGEDEPNGMPMHLPTALDTAGIPKSPSATMPAYPQKVENGMTQVQMTEMGRQVSDGLEWDTGVQLPQKHKPNIEMFLPMLRVLGKGSFGKVCLFVSLN